MKKRHVIHMPSLTLYYSYFVDILAPLSLRLNFLIIKRKIKLFSHSVLPLPTSETVKSDVINVKFNYNLTRLVGITKNYRLPMLSANTPHIALVCFIADPFDPPGYERYGGGHLFIFDLGRYLIQKGFKVSFFTRLNSSQKSSFDKLGPNCSIHRLEIGPREEIAPVLVGTYLDELSSGFVRRIEHESLQFTAIHSHYWIAGEVARRFCSSRSIQHVHSVLSLGRLKSKEPGKSARDECEIKVFNSADILLTVCPSEFNDLKRLYPEVNSSNVLIIPYGVDPDVFYARPQSEHNFVCRQTRRFKKRTWTTF